MKNGPYFFDIILWIFWFKKLQPSSQLLFTICYGLLISEYIAGTVEGSLHLHFNPHEYSEGALLSLFYK